MKLKDLFSQTSWPQVAIDLVTAYPNQRKSIERYANVYEYLGQIEPVDTETVIHIEKTKDDFEPELYYDHLYGMKREDDGVTYVLSYCPWEEWLGMEIASKTIADYTECEIVAICLYEMTWAGFDEKTIDSFVKKYLEADIPELTREFIDINENLTEIKYEFKPTVKWLMSDLTRFIRWGTVSKEYFGKKREWFIQNILTDATPAELERIDILALKGALKDIADEINNVIEKL